MLTDLGPELAVPQVRQLAENPASRGFGLSWLEANGMLDVAAPCDLDDRTASPRCCFHRLVTTEPAGCWRLWRWPETTTGRPGWPLSSAARRRRQPIPYWADRRPSLVRTIARAARGPCCCGARGPPPVSGNGVRLPRRPGWLPLSSRRAGACLARQRAGRPCRLARSGLGRRSGRYTNVCGPNARPADAFRPQHDVP